MATHFGRRTTDEREGTLGHCQQVTGNWKWLASVAALVFLFACPLAVYGQGCPLCYNTAAAAKAGAIQALRSGILILIIPSLAICAGILRLGIQARNRFNEPEGSPGEPEQELPEMLARMDQVPEAWKADTGTWKLEAGNKDRG